MPAAAGTSTWVGVGPVAAAVCSASLTFQMCWLRLRHPRRQSTLHRQAATTLSRPTVGSNSNAPPPRSRSAAIAISLLDLSSR